MNKASEKALQRIIVVVDELAELVDAGGANKEEKAVIQSINRNLRTLARIARALGVHLLLGIQRPDSSIIDGQIKSNVPFRVCGRFADSQASIIVLGNTKATQLPSVPGRFIVGDEEVQAYYFKREQIGGLRPLAAKIESIQTSPLPITKQNDSVEVKTVSSKSSSSNPKILNLNFDDLE